MHPHGAICSSAARKILVASFYYFMLVGYSSAQNSNTVIAFGELVRAILCLVHASI